MAVRIGGGRAQKLVNTKGALLLDLRDPVAFRDGTIAGAINVTLRQLTAILVKERKNNTPLIFFCEAYDDAMTNSAISYAEQAGFTSVFNLGVKDNWGKR